MTFAYDNTGSDVANQVNNEAVNIAPGEIIYVSEGLFYEIGLSISYSDATNSATPLARDVDFELLYVISGVVYKNDIYAAIKIINPSLNGTGLISYQAVGGNWIINQGDIAETLRKRHTFSSRLAYLALKPANDIYVDGVGPVVLNSDTAMQTAMTACPNGVLLTVDIRPLPTSQQIYSGTGAALQNGFGTLVTATSSSSGSGGTGTQTGGGGTESNYALETGGNLSTIALKAASTASAATQLTHQLPSAVGPAPSASALPVVMASDAVTHVVVDNYAQIGGGGGGTVTADIGTTGGLALDTTLSAVKTSVDSLETAVAKETGGNLDAIKTSSAALQAAQGTSADVAYAGTGNSTVVAALKGIYAKVASALNIRALTAATDSVTVQGGNTTAVKVDGSAVTQPISVAALPLPSGAATDSTLQSILSAIQATKDLAETVWFDATVATPIYYVRRVTIAEGTGVVTVSWQNIDGTAATPTVANLKCVTNAQNINSQSAQYLANAGGTGYSSGDILFHVYGVDTATATASIAYSFWLNATTGATLASAPTNGTYSASSSSTVSVSSSVLPANAAQETGGNLATIATAQGAPADTAYTGAGSSSIVAALKGIYAKVAGALNIRALSSGTDSVTTVPSGTQVVSSAQLPAALGATTAANSVSITPGTDVVMHVNVDNYAQISGGGGTVDTSTLAKDTTLTSVLNAIKAQQALSDTIWFDGTVNPPTYYIRRESIDEGTGAYSVTWENPDGTTAAPTVANLTAVANARNINTQSTQYLATGSGTGYSANDILFHAYGIDTSLSTPAIAYNFWLNASTGATLGAAPTNGTYSASSSSTVSVSSSALPANAAQETGGNLAAVAAAQGTTADAAYAGTGNSSVVAALKGLYAKLAGTLTVGGSVSVSNLPATQTVAGTVTANVQGGNTTAVKVDGSAVTQPVSATSLPLPTGAATETGNLAAVATAQGAPADAAYSGTGSGSVVALLKGLYAKLAGTVNTRALASGTDSVTATISGTPAVTVGNTVAVSNAQLPASLGAKASTASMSVVLASDQASVPVTVSGASSLAQDASIQTLINTVKATQGLSVTVWFDPTVNPAVYYVRRETLNEGTGVTTIGWENPDGTTASPTVANLHAVSNARNINAQTAQYSATSGGTGYSSGDLLFHAYGIDTSLSTPAVVYNFWLNATTGATLASAPTGGTYAASSASSVSVTSSVLPTNAAQETGGNLAAVAAAQGTTADAAYAGSGNASNIALLKGNYGQLGAIKIAINGNTSITDTVWVDNTGSTFVYYLRRASFNTQNGAVIAWFNLDGTAASPTLANLKPTNAVSEVVTNSATYSAAQAGTGYSVGDMLIHTYGLNVGTNPMTLDYSYWLNATTGSLLASAPASAALQASAASSVSVSSSALPTGAATDATLQAISALQQQIENIGEVIADAMVAALNKYPRLTAAAQQVVYVEGTAGVSAGSVINGYGTSTDGNVLLPNGIPMGIGDAGSIRNYNQLGFDGQ